MEFKRDSTEKKSYFNNIKDTPDSLSRGDIDTIKMLTSNEIIGITSGDIVDHIKKSKIQETYKKKSDQFYSDIIFALIHIRLPEEEAKNDWEEILRHKFTVSQTLNRNVGMHVAILDYYTNIKRRVTSPTILNAHEYAETASKAILDELTNMYNRSFFSREFRRHFLKAGEDGAVFSIIMIDIDYFKIYNDINGHIRGDIALIETGRIINAVCSSGDIAARYGGEEFIILLPGQETTEAFNKAENIRKAIYEYRFDNEQQLPDGRLTVSLGVTSFRKDTKDMSDMVEEADVALYRAKNGGKNMVKCFLKESVQN